MNSYSDLNDYNGDSKYDMLVYFVCNENTGSPDVLFADGRGQTIAMGMM